MTNVTQGKKLYISISQRGESMIINVTDDKLASLMILDKELEQCPEPYRGNADNTIIINLSVYKSFIENYLFINDYLATDTARLKSQVGNPDDTALCQSFYRDMARSVMKELWYTDITSRPTVIHHEIDNVAAGDKDYIDVISQVFAPTLRLARKDLLAEMNDNGYKLPVNKIVKFDDEVNYAVILYAMSSSESAYGVPFSKWSYIRS